MNVIDNDLIFLLDMFFLAIIVAWILGGYHGGEE